MNALYVNNTCFYTIKRKKYMTSRLILEETRLVFQALIRPTSLFANWKSRRRNSMNTLNILSYACMMQLCVLSGFCPTSPISFLVIVTLFKQLKALSFKKCLLWLSIVAVVWDVFSPGFILELFLDLSMLTHLIASQKFIIIITTSRNSFFYHKIVVSQVIQIFSTFHETQLSTTMSTKDNH
jgi:hypothetical protein